MVLGGLPAREKELKIKNVKLKIVELLRGTFLNGSFEVGISICDFRFGIWTPVLSCPPQPLPLSSDKKTWGQDEAAGESKHGG